MTDTPLPTSGLPPEAEIDLDEALRTDARIVDVRAPLEFAEDRIPGARSVPLFSDRERAVVGTLFRHLGQREARDWGEDRVLGRLDPFVAELRAALDLHGGRTGSAPDPRPRVICCARGGERSAAVTALLRGIGLPVRRLRGGYRSYRERVRARLAALQVPAPHLLDGLTGCGKTAVLRAVARRFPGRVLDLEALAGHRSSLLGDIGLEPASQKRFESDLVASVDRLEGPWTLIEAESRRVGDREIPPPLFRAMRAAPRIELSATLPERIALLRADYLGEHRSGEEMGRGGARIAGRVEAVMARLDSLAAYAPIGPEGVARLRDLLAADEIDRAVRILLEDHYDPRYRHGNRDVVPVARIELAGDSPRGVERTAEALIERLDHLAAPHAAAR